MVFVEEMVGEARALRYQEHRPTYQLLATWLNSHGGKDPSAKKLPPGRAYSPEELMPPWDLPPELVPLRFTKDEAQAILDAIPHLKGANWVFQALVNRVMPLAEIERAARD